MFHLKFLFTTLAIFKIASSLPVEEKIKPVELYFQCLYVPTSEEEYKTKSPVLLLHGLGGSHKVWSRLMLLLADRTKREVCAVDLRNHGDSPWNNRTDIEALATDVGHFLDEQGIKKVNILGQSLGGKTAIHYALKHPDRVDSIITEDISPNKVSREAMQQVAGMIQVMTTAMQSIPEGVNEEDAKKSIISFINKKFEEMGSSERVPDSFSEYIQIKLVEGKWRFKFNIDVFGEAVKDLERFWTVSSGLYEGPALFIYGTKSPFKVGEDKENILKLFPKAELFPVEGAGHMIHSLYREFDDAVIRFLNKVFCLFPFESLIILVLVLQARSFSPEGEDTKTCEEVIRELIKMFQRGIFFATLLILEVVYTLPVEEKIEPIELFHRCIDPMNDGNEPDKSPVLLLHALLGSHKNYDKVDQLISDRTKRRVCSVDLRNHGDSPWNNRSDIASFAVDIAHFLDKQNIKKVNLIGESLGGKVAIHYALNNPDRVDSIVVEDIRPNNIKKSTFLFYKFFVRLLKKIIDSQPRGMNENEAKEWAIQASKKLFEQMKDYEKFPDDISSYLDFHLVNGKWQPKHNIDLLYETIDKPEEIWTKSAGLYTGPTLFFYGTESMFKVGEDEEILKLFPNAKLMPIEGAGHLIHQCYREFDDIVVNFLNEIN